MEESRIYAEQPGGSSPVDAFQYNDSFARDTYEMLNTLGQPSFRQQRSSVESKQLSSRAVEMKQLVLPADDELREE